MGHLNQARASQRWVWDTQGTWGSFPDEGWSFLQLHGLIVQVRGIGKEPEGAKKGREGSRAGRGEQQGS